MVIDKFSVMILKEKIKPDSLTVKDLRFYYGVIKESKPVDKEVLISLGNIFYVGVVKSRQPLHNLYDLMCIYLPKKARKDMPLFKENLPIRLVTHVSSSNFPSYSINTLISIHFPLRANDASKHYDQIGKGIQVLPEGSLLFDKTIKELKAFREA